MGETEKRGQRYLDELDRRSPVSLSGATRARDVSRPNKADLDRALKRLGTQASREEAATRPSPRNG